jgi:hypothetical protein
LIGSIRAEVDVSDKSTHQGRDTVARALTSFKHIRCTIVAAGKRIQVLKNTKYIPNLKYAGYNINRVSNHEPDTLNWLFRHSLADAEMLSQTESMQADIEFTAKRLESLAMVLKFLHAVAQEISPQKSDLED